ncbi:MAG: M48 family metallopeptidase [Paludibacteraceae bacterium]|nr:M48 family metallopeptidase [Paludibacteraceae bacterium]
MSILYYIVIVLILLDFLWGRTLSLLNLKASYQPIPEEISDLYDHEQHARQQAYMRANMKFGWAGACLTFLLTLLFFALGGFGWLDQWVRSWVSGELWVSLVYFGVIYLALFVIGLPFEVYDTFVIEARFGFNKTDVKTFVTDRVKSLLLTMLMSAVLLGGIILIYEQTNQWFWVLAWGLVTLFGLFMSMFYSQLIVPLFNKQTPLPEGELRDAIQRFAQQVDFPLTDIYVIDSSKRSTKGNAYFTGWGKKKRIVIYDTLIEQLSSEEIVAVLAHEIGHYKHRHTIKSFLLQMPFQLLMFYVLGLMLDNASVAEAASCVQPSFHVGMIMFSFLYTPLSLLTDIILNYISRMNERQADGFAKTNGQGEALIRALKKISSQSLSNPTPHAVRVFVEYSHPTLTERIRLLRAD